MKVYQDSALVRQCLDGDNRSFETLVSKYQGPIYNLALRMVKVPEDAEDISQTVFVKAYEKLHSYNPAYRFFSWIYRIAVNESINFSRRRKRMDEYESGVSGRNEITPEQGLRKGELSDIVGSAISSLKMDYRLVLVLKHFHDFTYLEIGDILQIPEKTVKSRLFTARQLLKDRLDKEGVRG
jgi:RNA polymerase sigma-70 factor (ECF subfamily)